MSVSYTNRQEPERADSLPEMTDPPGFCILPGLRQQKRTRCCDTIRTPRMLSGRSLLKPLERITIHDERSVVESGLQVEVGA